MIRAILFDCNGVISDDELIHMRLFQKILKEEGIALPRNEYFKTYLALDDKTCFKKALEAHGQNASINKVQELVRRKGEYYKEVIKKELRIFPGVKSFVKRHQKKYILAVVSGALRHEIDLILEHAGIISSYSTIVSSEDVKKSKPHPESYILGWKRLNQLPQFKKNKLKAGECLVIEDAVHGVEAARKAGMKCLAVTNSYSNKDLKKADKVVSSLKGIQVDRLKI